MFGGEKRSIMPKDPRVARCVGGAIGGSRVVWCVTQPVSVTCTTRECDTHNPCVGQSERACDHSRPQSRPPLPRPPLPLRRPLRSWTFVKLANLTPCLCPCPCPCSCPLCSCSWAAAKVDEALGIMNELADLFVATFAIKVRDVTRWAREWPGRSPRGAAPPPPLAFGQHYLHPTPCHHA